MRSRQWDRGAAIADVRRDIWRHLTQAASNDDDILLHAAALLRMRTSEVRELSQLQFVLSGAVARLLSQMPLLIRRLTTTTMHETEASAERVRGPIRWSETFATRAAAGLPHLYVTAPARRAFRTPENELLVFALEAISRFGRATGWAKSTSAGVGSEVRDRTNNAIRWRQARALLDVPTRPPSAKTISRVRSGRQRRTYAAVLDVIDLYQRYVARLDRAAIREAVENHALVTRHDPTLFELMVVFRVLDALKASGWTGAWSGLLKPPTIQRAHRGSQRLTVLYQHAPAGLSQGSIYRDVQRAHDFQSRGGLIPDLVLKLEDGQETRWVMIEVKLYTRVEDGGRAATLDLLAYRRAFEQALHRQTAPYGIGVPWGAELAPTEPSEVLLASLDALPDVLTDALA